MSESKLTIAVDGFSSCGKSTVAKQLAQAYDFVYVDSGAMYRAVSLYLLRNGISVEDQIAVDAALDNIDIRFELQDGHQLIMLNDEPVDQYIRSAEINAIVSEVAKISSIRSKLVQIQREISVGKSVVMDGRDIGTVVFPKADLKFFLTAEIDIRAQRRFDEQLESGISSDLEEVKKNLAKRDRIDSTREDSPLKQADDAVLIDNSYLTKDEQLNKLKKIIDNYVAEQKLSLC